MHRSSRPLHLAHPAGSHTEFRREFDRLMYFVGILGPFAVVPQIWQIYVQGETGGVSPFAWALFGLLNILWLTYGVIHRVRPVVIANLISAVLSFVVAAGVLIHR